jgi:hypothetical protein
VSQLGARLGGSEPRRLMASIRRPAHAARRRLERTVPAALVRGANRAPRRRR